ncbi:MAG: SIR2 family protein [Turicibacter sanguinis]|uniref:NAD(+) hydrolase ThsA Sir2/TIR-associating SLOG domain-containing protein n=3 Tax=Turicibacter sanguinis TaxID=154288 RepID=A0A9X5AQJ3_9FIRM|nr:MULTISPECIES: SIR2 family protein [Turicibacter]EFF65178.1 conserved domain protein [Turicibacter sanguinis PC909]MBP3904560.1 SIR2 family protein [Turicibacter sp.]MCU7192424.1 SIR2 family protein [Turicibacter sanguinis]MCU7197233.1 SIR2 family protein [Turicibacter sanguinis]MDB8437840.1 SIR2 family protein [Turicibacter sanguinis]
MAKNIVINEFSTALVQKKGAIFIGAGISVPSGFKSWVELLREMQEDIDLEIDDHLDLTEVAQFIVNNNLNNKGRILNKIVECYTTTDGIYSNKYHKVLAQMNVTTIWTTNYDTLLEESFRHVSTVIRRCDTDLLPIVDIDQKVEIIKMHGSVDSPSPENLVITKEDYEDYFYTHPLTTERLKNDLLNKSFLFIGYSYRDSNIRSIMTQIRQLCSRGTRTHYMVVEKEKNVNSYKLQKLWAKDLERFGIKTYIYENADQSHRELLEIMESIAQKSKGNTLFVTGSHTVEESAFLEELGVELARIKNLTLINGQSKGVANIVLKSFIDECLNLGQSVQNRIEIYANPCAHNEDWETKEEYGALLESFKYRLVRQTQIMIVLPGSYGTKAEIEKAKQLGTIIIPIITEDRNELIDELLENINIVERLKIFSPSLYHSLKNEQLTTVDEVIECVKNILAV